MTTLYTVEKFISRRGGHVRGGLYNGICFTVKWENYDQITTEPIQNFIELGENDDPIHCDVVDQISHYNNVALHYPYRNRKCLTCDNKVRNGRLLCKKRHYCIAVKNTLKNIYKIDLI